VALAKSAASRYAVGQALSFFGVSGRVTMSFTRRSFFIAVVLWGLAGVAARAEVKLHGLFTDHMVLQRGMPVPVWGTAADGEQVKVEFCGHSVATTAAGGKWKVELPALEAGGPHELVVSGGNTLTLHDVLVGEVWLASGQSNMQWAINQSADPPAVIAASDCPQLRLFTVNREFLPDPILEVRGGPWKVSSPETTPDFTAVGYHFGRHLQTALGVPVGILSTNLGGTAAEWWTSKETLAADPELAGLISDARSSGLYNAMIAPLVPFACRGVIWYQGESNAGRAWQYRRLFPTMIQNWRKSFGQDFPFLFVQLAPFHKIVNEPGDSDWAELREAQLHTMQTVPKTGMAVITDVGDEVDIHPKQKEPVGARLALAARAIAYGEAIEFSGPVFEKLEVRGKEAVLRFSHLGGGLEVRGEKLTGFAIAGEDKKFHNADARIEGETVVVSCPAVANPVAVRFGWANFPVVNLWNKAGLPASPFRTDNFKVTTQP
jgi:sialate O-acetylesterase